MSRKKGEHYRNEPSVTIWGMRASKTDRANISRLASLLNMKESDAVRYAVAFALNKGIVNLSTDEVKSFIKKKLVGFSPRR